MPPSLKNTAARIDSLVGEGVERAVEAKHRRRLARLDQTPALRPDGTSLWASGDPPPRPGCSLDVLIDGAEAFPVIAEAIAGARATTSTSPAGMWPPTSSSTREPSRSCSGACWRRWRRAIDVRVLVWAGAPVPLFHPTRKEVQRGGRDADARHADPVRARPARAPVPLPSREDDHHRRRARLRWRHRHDRARPATASTPALTPRAAGSAGTTSAPGCAGPRSPTWLDHFALRWHEVTGERLDPAAAAAEPAGDHTVQVVRTVAEGMYDARAARGLPDPRELHPRARAAPSDSSTWRTSSSGRRRSSASSPTSCATRRPTTSASSSCCPPKANNGHDDTRGQLGVLVDADDGAGRLLAATLRSLSGGRDDRALRSRQGRDRRRPLADDRIGQPQRPLAAQRH